MCSWYGSSRKNTERMGRGGKKTVSDENEWTEYSFIFTRTLYLWIHKEYQHPESDLFIIVREII